MKEDALKFQEEIFSYAKVHKAEIEIIRKETEKLKTLELETLKFEVDKYSLDLERFDLLTETFERIFNS